MLATPMHAMLGAHDGAPDAGAGSLALITHLTTLAQAQSLPPMPEPHARGKAVFLQVQLAVRRTTERALPSEAQPEGGAEH